MNLIMNFIFQTLFLWSSGSVHVWYADMAVLMSSSESVCT